MSASTTPLPALSTVPTIAQRRRLRAIWRSAGWPCQDTVEIELLACGWLERLRDGHGRETLRLTDAGILVLAEATARHRQARSAHELLIDRVIRQMQREGRFAWRGITLRAPIEREDKTDWVLAMPDVYSVRHTSREDATEPIAHEVKVHRADLLSDLRKPEKALAYRNTASQCWYVLKAGIAKAEEIPPDYGVMFAHESELEIARPAPKRPMKVPFAVWLVLARAVPAATFESEQLMLGECAAGNADNGVHADPEP